jgi:hypothetical protein
MIDELVNEFGLDLQNRASGKKKVKLLDRFRVSWQLRVWLSVSDDRSDLFRSGHDGEDRRIEQAHCEAISFPSRYRFPWGSEAQPRTVRTGHFARETTLCVVANGR